MLCKSRHPKPVYKLMPVIGLFDFDTNPTFSKGTEFYRELSELVATLRSEVSQFVSGRANERSAMISNAEMKKRLSTNTSGDSLDRSFDTMSVSSSRSQASFPNESTYQPNSPIRSNAHPSNQIAMQNQTPTSYHGYGTQGPPPRPPSTYSSYSDGSSSYPNTTMPHLPPKPPIQTPHFQPTVTSQYSQSGHSQSGHRQSMNSGALPAPPSHPSYAHRPLHSTLPHQASNTSLSSISSYNTAPPPPSTYSTATPSLSSQTSYSTSPSRTPSQYHANPQTSRSSQYAPYTAHPSPMQQGQTYSGDGQQQQTNYGSGPQQPFRQDSGFAPPPPIHPSRQQDQYQPPPQQQHLYQPRY